MDLSLNFGAAVEMITAKSATRARGEDILFFVINVNALITKNASENAFICPKCRDNLEIINLRLREQRPPPPPWERYSMPPRMVDPPILPECRDSNLPLKVLIASPPTCGYVAILKDPIEFAEQWHGARISKSEGVSSSVDYRHPFHLEGARWHLLKTLAGPRLGIEFVPFICCETQLQRSIDVAGKVHNIACRPLRRRAGFFSKDSVSSSIF
jgi:hypothetical protein